MQSYHNFISLTNKSLLSPNELGSVDINNDATQYETLKIIKINTLMTMIHRMLNFFSIFSTEPYSMQIGDHRYSKSSKRLPVVTSMEDPP